MMFLSNNWILITVFSLACFFIGLSKGGLGSGLAGLVTPMMALVMPVSHALGMMLPVLIVGDIFAAECVNDLRQLISEFSE